MRSFEGKPSETQIHTLEPVVPSIHIFGVFVRYPALSILVLDDTEGGFSEIGIRSVFIFRVYRSNAGYSHNELQSISAGSGEVDQLSKMREPMVLARLKPLSTAEEWVFWLLRSGDIFLQLVKAKTLADVPPRLSMELSPSGSKRVCCVVVIVGWWRCEGWILIPAQTPGIDKKTQVRSW